MRRRLIGIGLVACLMATSGCATVFAGGEEDVTVTVQQPASATVIVRGANNDDEVTATGPVVRHAMDRNSPYAIAVSADHYYPTMEISKVSVSPWYWADLLPLLAGTAVGIYVSPNNPTTGGLLTTGGYLACMAAIVIDLVTKDAYKHDKTEITVSLRPAPH